MSEGVGELSGLVLNGEEQQLCLSVSPLKDREMDDDKVAVDEGGYDAVGIGNSGLKAKSI